MEKGLRNLSSAPRGANAADRRPDSSGQVDGRVGVALGPHDLLQPPLELGTVEAWAAGSEVGRELEGPMLIEFPVEVELDLLKHLVAANL
jgi:hypothetical protein